MVHTSSPDAQCAPGALATGQLPPVSVVICSYVEVRWTELVAAIGSVQRQTRAACQILVVVDHNRSLFDRVQRCLPLVTVLESDGAPGLSGARNTGVAAASGDVIAFLDDDAVAEGNWLEQLLAPYADPRVAGVGGFIEPNWLRPPPAWFPDEFRWVVGCSYRGLPTAGGAVRNVIGANMSFRRRVFEAVGGFRSELGHSGGRPGGDEETELCIRLRQRWPQAIVMYAPAARVRHTVPGARTSFAYFRKRCFAEGMAKARVARLVGAQDGLASERSYAFSTLPSGVLRGVSQAVRHGELAGAARAAAITAGLAITSAGYAVQTLSSQ